MKRLHPVLETLGLIYLAKNFEVVKTELLASLEEMNIEGERFYNRHLSYLVQYVRAFSEKYSTGGEESFFFSYNTEFFLAVAVAAIELFDSAQQTPQQTAQENPQDIPLQAPQFDRDRILHILCGFFAEADADVPDSFHSMEDWFEALQTSECSEDTKWKLMELFCEPVQKFQELFMIYTANRPAFDYAAKQNDASLSKLISEAPQELSEPMRHLVSELSPQPKECYLTAVFPLIEWMAPGIIFQGVLADKVDLYQAHLKNAQEALPQLLKLIGDKSKFDILCLLKGGGKYNLEIAQQLQLTPATASHHMGMLLSNHMVSVEKKGGKVYYRLNQETIREMLRSLEEVFL